jgi:hypothetical protein
VRWIRENVWILVSAAILAIVIANVVVTSQPRWLFPRSPIREHPLQNPIRVISVDEHGLALADGRRLRPAGIQYPDDERRAQAMGFLRLAVAQGVVIDRDLGEEGSAVMTCEPYFYNWCGTGRIAGWYLQCGLAELMVAAGHATIADTTHLTLRERWRLQGATALGAQERGPLAYQTTLGIRFDAIASEVARIDEFAEALIGPAPP